MRLILKMALLTLSVTATDIRAHHSRTNFTLDQTVRISGTVTEFRWGNPHLYIKMTDDEGNAWLLEGHSIPGVMRLGWTRKSIVPGKRIAAGVFLDRERPESFALLDWVVTHDGQALKAFAASTIPEDVLTAQTSQGERRGPRTTTVIVPSTDFSGNWRVDFTGVDLRVAGFTPADGWPLTERGRRQVEQFDLRNDPVLRCVPRSLPGVLKSAYGYRFDRHADRLVMRKEHDDTQWTIWLDAYQAAVHSKPGRFGHSVGAIAEGTLTFTTTQFVADEWGLTRGVDSSAQKQVSARYTLLEDGTTIEFEYTVTDPVYLTAPKTVTGVLLKEPDRPFIDEPCDVENATLHLTPEYTTTQ